jgi:dTDP-4-amino-4,6-dideoxygalactose transaminase
MRIDFSPPDITETEIRAVADALRSGWITTGPRVKQFERELATWCGTSQVACLNSATAALECALYLLGVGPGDEVITSAYTYTASASVIIHVGATPVLVDTAPGSYQMDYEALADAITTRTKVVIPVDIAGVMNDYGALLACLKRVAERFTPRQGTLQEVFDRVIILADGAHSFGACLSGAVEDVADDARGGARGARGDADGARDDARGGAQGARGGVAGDVLESASAGQPSGAVADFTAFSFHAVKNLTTAEGGALTWRTRQGLDGAALYKRAMLFSLHGQDKDALAKNSPGAWEYDIVAPLYKCNMTDIAAALGLVQLERYPQLLARRHAIIARYAEGLASEAVEVLAHHTPEGSSSAHLCLTRLIGRSEEFRNRFIACMAKREITCNVHYKPLPLLTAYRNLGFDSADFPNACAQFENEVTLPLHTKLTDEEVDYVIASFKASYQECVKAGV